MPVVVTEENQQTVQLNQLHIDKAKNLLGAKTESETLELALEKVIEDFESKKENSEREEDFDFDIHNLNHIPPKKIITVKARFRYGGRAEPLKYDLSDYFDDANEE